MKKRSHIKITIHLTLLAASCLTLPIAWLCGLPIRIAMYSGFAALLIGALSIWGLWRSYEEKSKGRFQKQVARTLRGCEFAHALQLLDEAGESVCSWSLEGQTAVVIGRRGHGAEVDVDLKGCESHGWINVQHATLNYSMGTWYLEDLDSRHGTKIRKVEDGDCYQVPPYRPCKISAGDVIYIAKTKLLFK